MSNDRFENYPTYIGGYLAHLDREKAPNIDGIPLPLRFKEDLGEEAFLKYPDTVLASIEHGHLTNGRPGMRGADALYTWVEWVEYRSWLGDRVDGVLDGMHRASVALMASKIGLSPAAAEAFTKGDDIPTEDQYRAANIAAKTKSVKGEDLHRWLREMRLRPITDQWRGEAIAALALGRLDEWWGFRDMPGIAIGLYQ